VLARQDGAYWPGMTGRAGRAGQAVLAGHDGAYWPGMMGRTGRAGQAVLAGQDRRCWTGIRACWPGMTGRAGRQKVWPDIMGTAAILRIFFFQTQKIRRLRVGTTPGIVFKEPTRGTHSCGADIVLP
jgi:hypothetical protein